jgi:glycosyltransferase involved in cell wall biosynthesis
VEQTARTAPSTPIRVVYDVSVLGFGQYEELARTGVYRLVESLAEALARTEGCKLAFSASEAFRMQANAKRYLSRHHTLGRVPLLTDGWVPMMYGALNTFVEKAIVVRNASLPLRAARRFAMLVNDKITEGREAFPDSLAAKAQIFHSPYWALPDSTKKVPGLKRFLTVHDVIPMTHPEIPSDGGAFLTSVIKTATPDDWIVCVSQSTKDDLLSLKFALDPEKVIVIHEAASEKFFRVSDPDRLAAIKKRYGIPDGPYFVSVCTLERRKNLEHLIRCFHQLVTQQKLDELSLVLVGSKSNSVPAILKIQSELGIPESRLRLTGFVDDADLAPLYSGALGFVYPSFCEGFGLPPLEAMQCGVPVITSNTSSLPEVVGDAGIMVDPKSSDALCEAMLRLHGDTILRNRLARASLERASRFSWKRAADEHLQAYLAAHS